ncbi:MAG TPA: polymer-forming cytoskeletal protein [Burkholderiales bacterium]
MAGDIFFRRNTAPPRPMPPVAPAPMPAARPAAAPAAPAAAEDRKESRLIVGPDIKLKGVEITDCDTLVVEGRVEASLDSRVVQIAEHGIFSGKVEIDVAEIHGRFDGELTARKTLIVHASAKVHGKIRYGRLKVEEGGELAGDIAAITETAKPVTVAVPRSVV